MKQEATETFMKHAITSQVFEYFHRQIFFQ